MGDYLHWQPAIAVHVIIVRFVIDVYLVNELTLTLCTVVAVVVTSRVYSLGQK